MTKFTKILGAAAALSTVAGASFAAGTATGVEAGFFQLGQDLNTILNGAGGFVLLIASILIGGAAWVFTGRAMAAAASVGVALFLGYGVTILSSLSGTTATIDMVISADEAAAIEASEAL